MPEVPGHQEFHAARDGNRNVQGVESSLRRKRAFFDQHLGKIGSRPSELNFGNAGERGETSVCHQGISRCGFRDDEFRYVQLVVVPFLVPPLSCKRLSGRGDNVDAWLGNEIADD